MPSCLSFDKSLTQLIFQQNESFDKLWKGRGSRANLNWDRRTAKYADFEPAKSVEKGFINKERVKIPVFEQKWIMLPERDRRQKTSQVETYRITTHWTHQNTEQKLKYKNNVLKYIFFFFAELFNSSNCPVSSSSSIFRSSSRGIKIKWARLRVQYHKIWNHLILTSAKDISINCHVWTRNPSDVHRLLHHYQPN